MMTLARALEIVAAKEKADAERTILVFADEGLSVLDGRYCVRCRAPKPPAGDMVEYCPITEKFGNLVAICPDCDAIMNRLVSLTKIKQIRGKMEVSFPEAVQHIIDRANPTVNSDLR